MSEMVERVARAIVDGCRANDKNGSFIRVNEYDGTVTIDGHFDINAVARAAIEAMREPTDRMVEASNREWDGRMSHRSSGAWQAMIDAALTQTPQ